MRELFDLRGAYLSILGGDYRGDPYPAWHRLRAEAAVHPGIVHELTGIEGDAFFHGLPYPDRPHFSAFSFEACDAVYRDPDVFASSPEPVDIDIGEPSALNSMLSMGGAQHRRYRTLVQPSFVPAKAQWWIRNWIEETVNLLIDGFVDDGRAELNVDFCAAIPVLTITGSFGVPVERALDIRAGAVPATRPTVVDIIAPIVDARRESPQDDLISVLVQAEMNDDDGTTHRLSRRARSTRSRCCCSPPVPAPRGSRWASRSPRCSQRPDVLDGGEERPRARQGRGRGVGAMERHRSDVLAVGDARHRVVRRRDSGGVGRAHLHRRREPRPGALGPTRTSTTSRAPQKPTLAFGGGPHICLGMHVARAEMTVAINALLDRLPNLRLDPDEEPPQIIGMYERGATAIPVVFG